MNSNAIDLLANAYDEKIWGNFVKCFPSINKNEKFKDIPNDLLNVLVGILGESGVEYWLNTELELLENSKGIDLLKYEKGTRALKMFLLNMPN